VIHSVVAWDGPYRISGFVLIRSGRALRHASPMLGFAITSWMRFFFFGFLAGVLLCFVRFEPIAFLGKIDTVAAFLGLMLTMIWARSYEPDVWAHIVARGSRLADPFSLHPAQREGERRPILSP